MIRTLIAKYQQHQARKALRKRFAEIEAQTRAWEPELVLSADMIVRDGRKVIASEVESQRAKQAYARAAVKRMQADPLRRAA